MRGKPQFGHGAVDGVSKASCDRLLPRRDFECRRFGFGMVYLSNSLKCPRRKTDLLLFQFRQRIPSRVMRFALAVARARIQINSASRTEPFAFRIAKGMYRHSQANLLAHERINIDDLTGIVFKVSQIEIP